MDKLRKNKEEVRNSRLFLLENKLQSFYEDIKKLNEVTVKFNKEGEDDNKFFEKLNTKKNKTLNTNTYGNTQGDTNLFSEKSNVYQVDPQQSENKNLEINKILIQNPNKSKLFNGKNESQTNSNKHNQINNSPNGTIIKCNESIENHNEIIKDKEFIDDYLASDYSLVKFQIFVMFLFLVKEANKRSQHF